MLGVADGCHQIADDYQRVLLPAAVTEAQRAEIKKDSDELINSADAILFLGRSATLMYAPSAPDIYLDADYRQEINRRYQRCSCR